MCNESFDKFFREEYPLLVGFLVKTGFAREEAKDAAAEAMTCAYERWSDIDRPGGWVRTAAYRIACHQAQRTREGPLRAVAGGWPGTAYCDRDIVEDNEEHHRLLRLLRQLPRQQRLVMAWHLDGFDNNEISEMLGRPPSTIRSTLRHARDRLKEIYPAGRTHLRDAGADEGRERSHE